MSKEKRLFYGYIILAAVWIIYLCGMGFTTYGAPAINSVMAGDLNFNSSVLGVAVALCTLMQGVAGPITGQWISRKGIRAPYLVGTALILFATISLGTFVQNETAFVLIYGVIMGLGMGLGGILTAQSTVNNWFNKKKSFAMSLVLSAGAIGGFIAPQIIEEIISARNWKYGWLFLAGTCTLALVLILTLLKNSPADIGQYPDGEKQDSCKPQKPVPTLSFLDVCRDEVIYAVVINYVTRTALYYALPDISFCT